MSALGKLGSVGEDLCGFGRGIVLLNYYLWTCVINFDTSIVILDF